jgi:V-type H+-transporting ATPase subunit a
MVRMDLFRSEEMVLVQLIMPAESAHDTITYLAELSLLQFRDLNPGKSPFQQTYANQVKRYGEMSRKLRFFHDQVAKAGKLAYRPIMENVTNLDELDHKLGDLESELLEINANNDKLQSSQSELMELKLVLQNGATLFHSTRHVENGQQLQSVLDDPSLEESVSRPLLLEQVRKTINSISHFPIFTINWNWHK